MQKGNLSHAKQCYENKQERTCALGLLGATAIHYNKLFTSVPSNIVYVTSNLLFMDDYFKIQIWSGDVAQLKSMYLACTRPWV